MWREQTYTQPNSCAKLDLWSLNSFLMNPFPKYQQRVLISKSSLTVKKIKYNKKIAPFCSLTYEHHKAYILVQLWMLQLTTCMFSTDTASEKSFQLQGRHRGFKGERIREVQLRSQWLISQTAALKDE